MTYIDSVILNLTERSCRKFQLLTGRTNVWLAVQLTNLSIIVYFVWAGVYFWSSDVAPRIFIGVFCSGLLYVLTQTIFKVPIEAYEKDAYRRVANGLRNPRRVRDALLRLSFLTLSFVLCYPVLFVYINLRLHILLLSYSLIVLTTVVLYLLACDPLPPCVGKLTEWLRGSVPSRLAASEVSNVTHRSERRLLHQFEQARFACVEERDEAAADRGRLHGRHDLSDAPRTKRGFRLADVGDSETEMVNAEAALDGESVHGRPLGAGLDELDQRLAVLPAFTCKEQNRRVLPVVFDGRSQLTVAERLVHPPAAIQVADDEPDMVDGTQRVRDAAHEAAVGELASTAAAADV